MQMGGHYHDYPLFLEYEFAVKAWRTCVYFFYKIIIFHHNKEKDDVRRTYVSFNSFHETVNSHNLETAYHIAHIIFVLHSAMKTHL